MPLWAVAPSKSNGTAFKVMSDATEQTPSPYGETQIFGNIFSAHKGFVVLA